MGGEIRKLSVVFFGPKYMFPRRNKRIISEFSVEKAPMSSRNIAFRGEIKKNICTFSVEKHLWVSTMYVLLEQLEKKYLYFWVEKAPLSTHNI